MKNYSIFICLIFLFKTYTEPYSATDIILDSGITIFNKDDKNLCSEGAHI